MNSRDHFSVTPKTKCSLCNVAQHACLACTRSCFQSSAFLKQAHWPTCDSGTWKVGTGRSEQGYPWQHGVQSRPRLEILSQKIKLKLRILRMETQLRVGGETRYFMCVKNLKFLHYSYTGGVQNPREAFLSRAVSCAWHGFFSSENDTTNPPISQRHVEFDRHYSKVLSSAEPAFHLPVSSILLVIFLGGGSMRDQASALMCIRGKYSTTRL